MDFRKFLEMVADKDLTEAKKKKESTAEKDHKAEKAGKEVTSALKSGVSAAGDALISAGTWLKSMSESLEDNNGELVLEWLEY